MPKQCLACGKKTGIKEKHSFCPQCGAKLPVVEKPGTYVSERVVNIKELENYIETAHLETASLLAEMKSGIVPDTFLITKRLNAIHSALEKAYGFEFCVERRTTLCR